MIEPFDSLEGVREQRRQPQRCERVRLQRVAQGVVLDGGQRLHRRDREGVVEQAVDPAVLLEGGVDEPLAGVLVVDVGGYDERATTVRPDHLGHLVQPLLGARDQHQVGAELGRLLAERAAQPGPDARRARRPSPPTAAVTRSREVSFEFAERAVDVPEIRVDRAMDARLVYVECPVGVLERASSARSACWRVHRVPGRRITRSSFGRCRPGGRRCGRCSRRSRSGCRRSGGAARRGSRTAPPRRSGPSEASRARESRCQRSIITPCGWPQVSSQLAMPGLRSLTT